MTSCWMRQRRSSAPAPRRRRSTPPSWLPMPDEIWDRAIDVQVRALHKGSHRALSMADLLVAATAERHGATVLHYDGDFDMIQAITGQQTTWVVPAGTAD